MFGDVRRGRFLQLAEFRIGAVCGIGDCGLTRAFLGEAWRTSVGNPDLDGSQPLRSEGGSTLRDALCAGGRGQAWPVSWWIAVLHVTHSVIGWKGFTPPTAGAARSGTCPRVDHLDTRTGEVPHVSSRHGHALRARDGRDLTIRLRERTPGGTARGGDVCVGACRAAVERKNPAGKQTAQRPPRQRSQDPDDALPPEGRRYWSELPLP